MTNYYIYHIEGIKIGVTTDVPRRMKEQGFTEWEHLETHTCVYEVSDREQELQRQYGLPVDLVPYHVVYLMTQNSERNDKISETQTGRIMSDETKAKMSVAKKGKTRTEETKTRISESRIGIARSAETCANISAAQKGIPKTTSQCPHCELIGSKANMTRYHFDNCKHK